MSDAPSAQLTPTAIGFACATEIQKLSTVCPDSVRPLLSVIVTETAIGIEDPAAARASHIPSRQALTLSVSMAVSHSRKSTPPSIRPRACSAYEARTSSNVTARKPGSSTRGDSERVLFVGPIDPATKRGFSAVVQASAASRATRAAATLMS